MNSSTLANELNASIDMFVRLIWMIQFLVYNYHPDVQK